MHDLLPLGGWRAHPFYLLTRPWSAKGHYNLLYQVHSEESMTLLSV